MIEKTTMLDTISSIDSLLIKRIFILFIIVMFGWGLVEYHNVKENEFINYYSKIVLLDDWANAEDIKAHIFLREPHNEIPSLEVFKSDNIKKELYHDMDIDMVFYEVEKNNYEDRTPIFKALSELKANRRAIKESKEFSLFGITISIKLWVVLIPFFIMVVFHNMTQLLYLKREWISKLNTLEELTDQVTYHGIPFNMSFGIKSVGRGQKYIQTVSSVVFSIFLLFVIFTLFIFAFISLGLDDYNSEFITGINLILFFVAFVDFVLIIYRENLFNIKNLISWYSKDINTSMNIESKITTFFRLFSFTSLLLLLHINIENLLHPETNVYSILYYCTIFLTSSLLPIGTYKYLLEKKHMYRLMVFSGVIINIFWFFLSFIVLLSFTLEIVEIVKLSFIIVALSIPAYLMFNHFFEMSKNDALLTSS